MEAWKKAMVLSAAWMLAGLWASSVSAGGPPPTTTTISIDDSTETLTLSVNGAVDPGACSLTPLFEQCLFQIVLPGSYPSVAPLNVLEPGTGAFSDFINVFGLPSGPSTLFQISFRSDLDGVPCTIIACGLVGAASVTETAGLHTFADITESGGNRLIVNYVSDVESTVPEPATLALFAVGLAGLGFSRRRKLN